jgi:hypothetical protein
MKRILAILVLSVTPALLFAETVMVYVSSKKEIVKDESKKAKQELVFSLEGGVMDEFFENGHIIFNAGKEDRSVGEFTLDKDSFPLYMAKSGGASYLLNVSVRYWQTEEKEPEWRVASAEYKFVKVETAEVLRDGTVEALYQREKNEEELSAEENSFNVGRAVAQDALALF